MSGKTEPSNRLLNTNEAAKLLGISARGLWRLTKAGQVPHLRVGHLVKYSPEALREWINSQLVGGTHNADK